jgi:hypothetical protein
LHTCAGTWFAVASRPNHRVGVGVSGVGASPLEAATRAQECAHPNWLSPIGSSAEAGAVEQLTDRLSHHGYRVVWWQADGPNSPWRVTIYDEYDQFFDSGMGETPAEAIARVAANAIPHCGPVDRLARHLKGSVRRVSRRFAGTQVPMTAKQAQPERRLANRMFVWVAANAGISFTIASVLLYGVVRASYAAFYARFGLEPEDVGLGETRMPAQSAIAVAILLAVTAVFAVITRFAFGVFKAMPRRLTWMLPHTDHIIRVSKVDNMLLTLRGRELVLPRGRNLWVPRRGSPRELPEVNEWNIAFSYALGLAFLLIVSWFGAEAWSLGTQARNGGRRVRKLSRAG